METKITKELEDLKEIAIAKIKLSYNHSIEIEAVHSVLWNITEKKRSLLLKLTLILSFILLIMLYLPILFGSVPILFLNSILSGFVLLGIVGLTFYSIFQAAHSKNHILILEGASSLRTQANDFLQYKLENLDKAAFINEINSLELNDKNLKSKSKNYLQNLSRDITAQITDKVNQLEKMGFKKYIITQQEIDISNEKLQKFSALKTQET